MAHAINVERVGIISIEYRCEAVRLGGWRKRGAVRRGPVRGARAAGAGRGRW